MAKWSDLVGQELRGPAGARYRCTAWDERKGLEVELLSESTDFPVARVRGDRAWISERAIGRTYHEAH